jgi:lipopolysaccharide/colanic/teichoic acid biosynthesis glycosyltransferase
MKSSTQLEPSPVFRSRIQPELLQPLEPSRSSEPVGLRQRWLAPATMWAELEHCRKMADVVEEPFTLLICTSRSSLSSKSMHLSALFNLNQFKDDLGPIGMLDRKRLGLVIRTNCEDDICKFADSVQESLGSGLWEFKVLTYPFALDREILLPDRTGRVSPLNVSSLQPLFALPTPWGKRAIDITLALVGLLVLLPFLLLVAALIRCSSAGPIFFKQRRSGLGGKQFNIYKFRTMVVNAEQHQNALIHLNEQDGPAFKMRCDPRVTRLGRLLRFTCIDELPQLWNVLWGEMSLVGPRPLPCAESDACRWWQRRRLDVLPGVTCTWQARGRSMVSFDEWMRMDLDYVRRRSLALDFQIVLGTFAFLISRSASRD